MNAALLWPHPLQPPGLWLGSSQLMFNLGSPAWPAQVTPLILRTKHTMMHKQILEPHQQESCPQLWAKACRTHGVTSGREQRTALCPFPRPFAGLRLSGLVPAPACIALTKLITTRHSPGWAQPCSRMWQQGNLCPLSWGIPVSQASWVHQIEIPRQQGKPHCGVVFLCFIIFSFCNGSFPYTPALPLVFP